MSHYLLDKAYSINEPAGVEAYRAVVYGQEPGQAKLPNGSPHERPLGITVHSQTRQRGHVAVRKAGIARVTAAGPIKVGEPVVIADAVGRLESVERHSGESPVECIGFAETGASEAGQIFEVFLQFHERFSKNGA